ncbi:MAG: hypothetical protein ACREUU_14980, partial [Gammaproteobacteria bacterium]
PHTLRAAIEERSFRGLKLDLAEGLSPGTAVKVEFDDVLLLGEVVHCRRHGFRFTVGLELEHAVYGTRDLARLAEAIRDGHAEHPRSRQS